MKYKGFENPSNRILIVWLVLGIVSVLSLIIDVGDDPFGAKAKFVDGQEIKRRLDRVFHRRDERFPDKIEVKGKRFQIEYTINKKLTKFIKKLLKRYRSDFSSVAVIENETGRILSVIGHERKSNKFNYHLPFSSTHPSASLFKIITSAALLEKKSVDYDTVFSYLGKQTTLYKYQLRDKKNRWTRYQSLGRAFASSNNVIFGKAAMKKLSSVGIYNMANRFGFNDSLMREVSLGVSRFSMPQNQYNLAELASGFNGQTLISPIHAAMFSSVMANDGILKRPRIIDHIIEKDSGEDYWQHIPREREVLQHKTIKDLRKMMSLTVKRGTARGSFRGLKRYYKKHLNIGGKTGSITGGIPRGKRDWFTAYAVPKDNRLGKGISICVMNINKDKWYVRSSYLAKEIIEYYYRKVDSLMKNISKINETKSGNKV